MYPLWRSLGPCQISFKSASIFDFDLIVAKAHLNFFDRSNHELIYLDERDWNHYSVVDFSDNGSIRHIIKAIAPLYDNANSNAKK